MVGDSAEKRWEWYRDDFSARLKPGAKRILMNTRWHEEDVAGRVLEQIKQGVVRGRVISIPAIAEGNDILGRKPGEYLWDDPEGYNYGEFLRARQRESIPMMWSALYQQRPAPEEGEYFKAAWLRPYTTVPAKDTLAVYGASDYAVTANGGDYTVHVVVGVDPDGRMYLLDLWRKQASSDEWVEAFCDLVREWKPREWAEEQGQIKAGVGPFIDRMQRERQAFVYRRAFPTRGDKAVRAQSIRGRMALDGLLRAAECAMGCRVASRSCCHSPPASTTTKLMRLGLIGQLLDTISAPATSHSRPRRSSPTTATAHMISAAAAPMSGSLISPRPRRGQAASCRSRRSEVRFGGKPENMCSGLRLTGFDVVDGARSRQRAAIG